jgi:hypothetical protein
MTVDNSIDIALVDNPLRKRDLMTKLCSDFSICPTNGFRPSFPNAHQKIKYSEPMSNISESG